MIFQAGPSKIFPCRQFFFPAVSQMKSWNVSFAQRHFLSVAFISCFPAHAFQLLSFTGSKFPCEFVCCCCSGDLCSACNWLSGSPEDLQPLQQQIQVPGAALPGRSHDFAGSCSWYFTQGVLKTRAQLRECKCFVLSNEHQLSQFKSQNEAGCGDSHWNLPKCRLWDDSRDGTMPLP